MSNDYNRYGGLFLAFGMSLFSFIMTGVSILLGDPFSIILSLCMGLFFSTIGVVTTLRFLKAIPHDQR